MKEYIAVTQQPCLVVMWDPGLGYEPPRRGVTKVAGLSTALLVVGIPFDEYTTGVCMEQVTWKLVTTRDEQLESCQSGDSVNNA